jgi:hypothetical protein
MRRFLHNLLAFNSKEYEVSQCSFVTKEQNNKPSEKLVPLRKMYIYLLPSNAYNKCKYMNKLCK